MSVYALVDCDSFYCNCERVFRPELRNVPVIVLSNNDGCAISRTREAKALGVEMGAPFFKIRDFCKKNNIAVFSSNFSLYTNLSSRVMRTLRKLSPIVEVYSVDEAFLDLSGIPNPLEYARMIKEVIGRETKIPVSIGLAPTKGLCKAACFLAKKDRSHGGVVSLLDKYDQDEVLGKMPIEKLWGIARGRGLSLKMLGIKTAKDFRDYKNVHLIQKILTKVGRQIQDELRGIVCFPLSLETEKKKEIMSSRTFGHSVYDKKTLSEAIASHAFEVAEELRSQKSVCKEVLVYVRSNPHKENIEQYGASVVGKFLTPTSNSFKIIEKALECLEDIWRPGIEFKKAGVRIMKLQDNCEYTLNMFEAHDDLREEALMKTMDLINFREGSRTVKSMSCGTNEFAWCMNRNHCSPKYTTSWHQIPKCK
ncbi:MAG: Y-family DNA polymerase [Bacteriovoracaceae bacterium]|nr:Y-family DNA polymerase [Bacteriovoracaceae bacterium]